jgi:ribosomal protein L19
MLRKTQLRENIPAFQSGDTVKVHVRIQEGNKNVCRFLKES